MIDDSNVGAVDNGPILEGKSAVFPLGDVNPYGKVFTGQSYLYSMVGKDEMNCPISNVTFEAGCRNNWHRHTAGQILLCTGGEGFYQEKGKPARRLHPGDVVEIPFDTWHWHGATADSWFAHIAITPNVATNEAEWGDPVTSEEYAAANAES